MATSLQPAPDPNAPPTPPKLTLQQGGLAGAPQAPLDAKNGGAPALTLAATQVPGQAGGVAPATTGTPAIPTPTVAAPSAPVDRLSLAESNFENFNKATDPAYQASLRSATSAAAGAGQLGSGQLRTSYGDLANQRALALDTQRQQLVNDATTGSIADATTAYQQQLAAAQQGLAGTVANANIENQKGQLELATGEATGTVGGQQTLSAQQLAQNNAIQTAGLTGILNGTQTLQAKQDAVNQAVAQGQLTVQQGQLALSQLAQSQSNTLATGQLTLAQQQEKAKEASDAAQLALAQKGQDLQNSQFNASLAQSGAQFQASLKQNADQFGLTQDQTQKLAELQNDTQNKQIDATTAQGKNQLLVALASIIGGPTGTGNSAALAAIAKQFGIILPTTGGSSGGGGGGGGGSNGGGPTDTKGL